MQEASEAENQMNAPNPESEQNISPEHEEFTDMPASSSSPSQPPTLHLTPNLQARCMATRAHQHEESHCASSFLQSSMGVLENEAGYSSVSDTGNGHGLSPQSC